MESPVTASTRVFLSYRREDSKHVAARIAERLDNRFKLFMDIDLVQPGMDFTSVVRKAISESDLLLAVIGPGWASVADASGRRRLDDPNDWVVAEIGDALRRDIAVVPVLVDGAKMPSREELPAPLAELANRQALTVAHESFAADCARLVSVVEALTLGRQAAGTADQGLFSDQDYAAAATAYFEEKWQPAIEHLERVLTRYPGQPHVTQRLTHARFMNRLHELDEVAALAAGEGRWRDAVKALEELTAKDPEFRNARDRLESARRRISIADLQAYIHTLAAAGQWTDLLNADGELAKLDRSAANPEGLADRARRELEEADLAAQYAAGLHELNRGNWQRAHDLLSALLAKRRGYRDADQLVAVARARLDAPHGAAPSFAQPSVAPPGPMPMPGPMPLSSFRPPGTSPPTAPQGAPVRKRASRTILLVGGICVLVLAIGLSVFSLRNLSGEALPAPPVTQPAEDTIPGPSESPSATDSGTPTTTSPEPTGIASPAEELRSHLPAEFSDDCDEFEPISEYKKGLVVAVTCKLGSGAPDWANYFQYETEDAMTKVFRSFTGPELPYGTCDKEEGESGWSVDNVHRGIVACYTSEGGDRVFVWTHEDLKILSIAGSKELSYAKLNKWWESKAGPVE
jgi:tetratricopeptide (TPR) repeat protein